MELRDYLLKALDSESTELVLAPGQCPRFRRERDWLKFESAELNRNLSATETRQWALQLCNEDSKRVLLSTGFTQGFWELQNQKLFYEIHSTEQGYLLQLQWLPAEWRDPAFWNFPKWTNESVWKGRGLHLLISPEPTVLEAAAESSLLGLNSAKKAWIVWVKAQGLSGLRSDSSLITYHQKIPNSCDIVILEGFENLEIAVEQAERGRGVILLLRHHSLPQSLVRYCREVGGERFSSQLRLAMNLRAIYGVSGWVPAYDLLANTTSVEESLKRNDISRLEILMKDSEKESGMRTMNQSLLQLMVKRKIDFKKGFEVSPAPQELDFLLKQIGI